MKDNQRNPMPVETRTETMMRLYRKALGPRPENMWVFLVARLSLGAIFIVSSASKLPDHSVFVTKVLSYHILPELLARPFAAALPFVELFVGCCLVLGVFIRFTSAASIPLILSFIVANLYALIRHVGNFDCSCFGDLIRLSHWASLAIDVAMIVTAGFLHSDVTESTDWPSALFSKERVGS